MKLTAALNTVPALFLASTITFEPVTVAHPHVPWASDDPALERGDGARLGALRAGCLDEPHPSRM